MFDEILDNFSVTRLKETQRTRDYAGAYEDPKEKKLLSQNQNLQSPNNLSNHFFKISIRQAVG